ncbi:hypothetical protein E2C01_073775 [Portunus trituberculatus]|uniref:Uncharacterized protein n=1 Tax=Portunus trituberculatus TaxID=210409 RepID=A0A5B7IBJ3_PORTR|nr:hypothetical protein [Portunus trituberculatus]
MTLRDVLDILGWYCSLVNEQHVARNRSVASSLAPAETLSRIAVSCLSIRGFFFPVSTNQHNSPKSSCAWAWHCLWVSGERMSGVTHSTLAGRGAHRDNESSYDRMMGQMREFELSAVTFTG